MSSSMNGSGPLVAVLVEDPQGRGEAACRVVGVIALGAREDAEVVLAEGDHPRVARLPPQLQALLLARARLVDVTLQQENVAEVHERDRDGTLVSGLDPIREALLVQRS